MNNEVDNSENAKSSLNDSTVLDDFFVTNYEFIEYEDAIFAEDEEACKTIERIKKLFTHFNDRLN